MKKNAVVYALSSIIIIIISTVKTPVILGIELKLEYDVFILLVSEISSLLFKDSSDFLIFGSLKTAHKTVSLTCCVIDNICFVGQMKQRHHSLTNPNIQWPTAEIIQRSVRRSNSKQTRVFLSGGDSVVPTRLPSNISIASLTSEIEHGVDGSILSSSESDQSIVQVCEIVYCNIVQISVDKEKNSWQQSQN